MTIDLSEGERLLAEATPGPWESVPLESGGFDVTTVPSRSGYSRAFGLVAKDAGGDDADAIVWLRNNAPALIQRARDADDLQRDLDDRRGQRTAMRLAHAETTAERDEWKAKAERYEPIVRQVAAIRDSRDSPACACWMTIQDVRANQGLHGDSPCMYCCARKALGETP